MDGGSALAYEVRGGADAPTLISGVTIGGTVANAPAVMMRNARTTRVGNDSPQTDAEITIENCINNADVTAENTNRATAFVSTVFGAIMQIDSCVNNGTVSGEEAAQKNQTCVGGIVGRVNSAMTINGCANRGDVTATATSERAYAGGIVGMCDGAAALTMDEATVYTGAVISNGAAVDKPVGNQD